MFHDNHLCVSPNMEKSAGLFEEKWKFNFFPDTTPMWPNALGQVRVQLLQFIADQFETWQVFLNSDLKVCIW